MREEEFVAQQRSLGRGLHFSDGVWWEESTLGFCKPAYELKEIVAGSARPSIVRSLLGYAHCVPANAFGNEASEYLVHEGDRLAAFDIADLKPRKRTVIRKAERTLEMRRIVDLEKSFGDMREIAIATAQRNGRGHGWRYYIDHETEWQEGLRRQFALAGREWWGAYLGERLIAFNYSYLVSDTMIIQAVKSHTAFLEHNPNDFLIFRFIRYCQTASGCCRIIFGGWTLPESQNAFKEQYGFRRTAIGVYASNRTFRQVARSFVKSARRARQVFRRRESGRGDAPGGEGGDRE